ncbi:MAG: hypothetical protein J0L92_32150 [Deltaproteobacteria bacterium]|nr:hypothetical protein [Deltaproteobacteria bacterium]
MNEKLAVRRLVVALAALGVGCTWVEGVDTGADASVDAAVDTMTDAASDTWTAVDANLPESRVVWTPDEPVDCTAHRRAPRWQPTGPVGETGSVRWVQQLRNEELAVVRASYPPPIEVSPFMPTGTDSGVVVFTLGNWVDLGFSHSTGELVHYARGVAEIYPHREPPEAFYTTFARMWLPEPGGIYGQGVIWSPLGLAGDQPQAPMSGVTWEGWRTTDWRPSFAIETAMPAWNPTTGARIQVAGTTTETGVCSVCEEGVQWITALPLTFSRAIDRPTAFYVRPDGDVIVATRFRMWVLDGATGEPKREARYGDPTMENAMSGSPRTYFPGCGVLVEEVTGTEWYWVNDDTMEQGPTLRIDDDYAGGVENWSGTEDCGVTVRANYRVIRLEADGAVRFDVELGPGFYGPIPTASGGSAFLGRTPGWVEMDAQGVELSRLVLDPRFVGETSLGFGLLAPDGTYYFVTDSGLGLVLTFGSAASGIRPGPFLWRDSGLNWAHTNSYFEGDR